ETDNWIWPRHTGDFSLFRIYADKNNQPADYSPDNVPYKPVYFFPISIKGVKEGDFTMVFGYPGSTVEYVPSYYIDMVKNYINPKIIDIRTKKINIMEEEMNTDPLIRIQYYAKKTGIANSWKKWQGEILGLEKMNTIARKQEFESRLSEWINADGKRKEKYGDLLPKYKDLYSSLKEYSLVNSYTSEVFNGAESFQLAMRVRNLAEMVQKNPSEADLKAAKNNLLNSAKGFFKDYNSETDMKLFAAVLELYGKNIDQKWLAPEYKTLSSAWKNDFEAASVKIYAKSPFTDESRFTAFINGFNKSAAAKLAKDPIYALATSSSDFISVNVSAEYSRLSSEIQKLNRAYMQAQMEFDQQRTFYPDANLTLRVAYGSVMGYRPRDAVYYTNSTTLSGIMEKDNPEIFDYAVPEKLKELYRNKDFGRYAVNGDVPVCFIANNHTTGGNSGSPVINAEGQLIGVNFDRAWEGVASDMAYNPAQSRNISLDIRYALFLIDKFAGAGYLLNEMKIVE
ncbi:MAG TPA: S46 family peptidase, partial [Bacteroidales bacterium]|nr:S46 family peptidase [Bacteroidales bacterium]